MTAITEKLIELGGTEWKAGDKHRIYFNNWIEFSGLEITHYNTGNISSARFNGKHVSNSNARYMIGGSVWYDVDDDKFMISGFQSKEPARQAAKALRAVISKGE